MISQDNADNKEQTDQLIFLKRITQIDEKKHFPDSLHL